MKLSIVSYEISEEVLLRDVIYAFQGIDGKYVQFDPFIEGFIVNPKVGVPKSARDIVRKLCEVGWLFRKIKKFVDTVTQVSSGLVLQSFCATVNKEISNFFKLIAILEAQLHSTAQNGTPLSLRSLIVWTIDPLDRLKIIAFLTDALKNKKGGEITSTLFAYSKHGDPAVKAMVLAMLKEATQPIFNMIKRWVFEGELEDPFQEFFVESDPKVSIENLWYKKYSIREKLVPSYFPQKLADKILRAGKSINFIRQVCKDTEWVMDKSTRSLAMDGK